MRVSLSRSSSLVVAVVAGLAISGCGGDDPSADGPPLTRAEYDLLVEQHREAKDAGEPADAAELKEVLAIGRRQCREIAASGPALRPTAPACREALAALTTQVTAGTAIDRCDDEDSACTERQLRELVESFDGVARALEQSTKATEDVQVGDACRTVLQGGPDALDDYRRIRDTGREMVAALGALGSGTGDPAADEQRFEAANERFEAANQTFVEHSGDLEALDPEPCEEDVAAG